MFIGKTNNIFTKYTENIKIKILRKISVFTLNVNEILKKCMIILRKEYASEASVSGRKKVKNPLNFS